MSFVDTTVSSEDHTDHAGDTFPNHKINVTAKTNDVIHKKRIKSESSDPRQTDSYDFALSNESEPDNREKTFWSRPGIVSLNSISPISPNGTPSAAPGVAESLATDPSHGLPKTARFRTSLRRDGRRNEGPKTGSSSSDSDAACGKMEADAAACLELLLNSTQECDQDSPPRSASATKIKQYSFFRSYAMYSEESEDSAPSEEEIGM